LTGASKPPFRRRGTYMSYRAHGAPGGRSRGASPRRRGPMIAGPTIAGGGGPWRRRPGTPRRRRRRTRIPPTALGHHHHHHHHHHILITTIIIRSFSASAPAWYPTAQASKDSNTPDGPEHRSCRSITLRQVRLPWNYTVRLVIISGVGIQDPRKRGGQVPPSGSPQARGAIGAFYRPLTLWSIRQCILLRRSIPML
jgi:hypothetical protein